MLARRSGAMTTAAQNADHPHLPPGRHPGPQSRRRAKTSGCLVVIFPIVAVVFALTMLSAAILTGEPTLYLAAVGGTAAFGGGGYAFYRSRRPRVAGHLLIATEDRELRRGDEVRLRLEISDPQRVGERVEVGLQCRCWYDILETHHSGSSGGTSRSRTTHEEIAWEEWRPASRSERIQSFSFRVPVNAPFSHEGSCLTFAWRVSVREPVSMRADPSRHEPIWVLP